MAKFQMINSTNPNTIAEVLSVSDIEGFRQNPEWVEMQETDTPAVKTTVKKPNLGKE